MKQQPNSRACFLCGINNEHSLKMKWVNDDENQRIIGKVVVPKYCCSYPGVIHGGIVAAILDETSGRSVMLNDNFNRLMVTMKLEVTYRQPTPCEEELTCIGWIEKDTGSRAHVCGELRKNDGTITATCKAVIVKPPQSVINSWEEEKEYWKVY